MGHGAMRGPTPLIGAPPPFPLGNSPTFREALHLWCYFVIVAVSRGLHRQRSDGDVIPSSVYKDRVATSYRGSARHRGLPVRLQQPRSCGNVSRLMDYILVCDLSLSVTCISIA